MAVQDIKALLSKNSYPGRGIVLGRGAHSAYVAYFIMGRSENSRNRVFLKQGNAVATRAADESKMQDPTLVIYTAARWWQNHFAVTNGDQTDTVHSAMLQGQTFEEALRTRTFEPDAPNYTPRISGLLSLQEGGCRYALSILKSANGNPASAQRQFFEYPQPLAGQGHFIHTYQHDGDPLPSFAGEPVCVAIEDDIHAFGDGVWQALDTHNKVSLFVASVHFETQQTDIKLYNQYHLI